MTTPDGPFPLDPAIAATQPRLETKVKAASAGAVVSSAVMWALTTYVFKGAIPVPIQGLVDVVVPTVVTAVSGWLAPHTSR
jgi:hypothetical protein